MWRASVVWAEGGLIRMARAELRSGPLRSAALRNRVAAMPNDSGSRTPHEISFSVDLATLEANLMPQISLAQVGIRERADLQRWIENHPEIIEPDLLTITTEFNHWRLGDKKVADRFDVLFLDSDGALLLAELKRDEAPDTTDLQAIKYAAYCSHLRVADVVDMYRQHYEVSLDEAKAAIEDHAPALAQSELGPIRVRIVAGAFGPSVTHVVMWLRDLKLDIGCIQIIARQMDDGRAVLTARQLLPPPAAEDYLVQRRRREEEEVERESTSRRRNTVTVLTEAGVLNPGQTIRLKLDAFSPEQRPKIEERIAQTPDYEVAEWTGLGNRKALRWRGDGEIYSCSKLIWAMLDALGFSPGTVPGPDYWKLANGKSLYEQACEIEEPGASVVPGQPGPVSGTHTAIDAGSNGASVSQSEITTATTEQSVGEA